MDAEAVAGWLGSPAGGNLPPAMVANFGGVDGAELRSLNAVDLADGSSKIKARLLWRRLHPTPVTDPTDAVVAGALSIDCPPGSTAFLHMLPRAGPTALAAGGGLCGVDRATPATRHR